MEEKTTKVIHKIQLQVIDGYQTKDLPKGAEVLKAGVQNNQITLWYLFANVYQHDLEPRHFRVYGTGHSIEMRETYIDTVMMQGLVWHTFETSKLPPEGA